MRVRDLMAPDGKVFLKSEWGQISDEWPCVSFTKASVGKRLRDEFRPGRDILVYVGTTDPEMTEDPRHRSRLLSAVAIEPNQVLETKKIVPPEVWERSVARWGNRWPSSMAVVRAANVVGPPFPDAHDVAPAAYRSFAALPNRGGVVLAEDDERERVMGIEVEELTLHLGTDVRRYIEDVRAIRTVDLDLAVKQEISRMADLIVHRVKGGGELSVKRNPQRTAPIIGELIPMLTRKWREQEGRCALCDGMMVPRSVNQLLQPSPDRRDSDDGSYGEENVQLTHLACNLGKMRHGTDDFLEWLDVVRGLDM